MIMEGLREDLVKNLYFCVSRCIISGKFREGVTQRSKGVSALE